MPRKDLVPVLEILARLRKEALELGQKYPMFLCNENMEPDTDIEKAYCVWLYRIDEETRRLHKLK